MGKSCCGPTACVLSLARWLVAGRRRGRRHLDVVQQPLHHLVSRPGHVTPHGVGPGLVPRRRRREESAQRVVTRGPRLAFAVASADVNRAWSGMARAHRSADRRQRGIGRELHGALLAGLGDVPQGSGAAEDQRESEQDLTEAELVERSRRGRGRRDARCKRLREAALGKDHRPLAVPASSAHPDDEDGDEDGDADQPFLEVRQDVLVVRRRLDGWKVPRPRPNMR